MNIWQYVRQDYITACIQAIEEFDLRKNKILDFINTPMSDFEIDVYSDAFSRLFGEENKSYSESEIKRKILTANSSLFSPMEYQFLFNKTQEKEKVLELA